MSFEVARFSDGITETKYDFALFHNGDPVTPISKEQLKEYKKTRSIRGILENERLLVNKFNFEENKPINDDIGRSKLISKVVLKDKPEGKNHLSLGNIKKIVIEKKNLVVEESNNLTAEDMKQLLALSLDEVNTFHPKMKSFLKKQLLIIKNENELIKNYHAKLLWSFVRERAVDGEAILGNNTLSALGLSTSVLKVAREELVRLKLISFTQKIIESRVRNIYRIKEMK